MYQWGWRIQAMRTPSSISTASPQKPARMSPLHGFNSRCGSVPSCALRKWAKVPACVRRRSVQASQHCGGTLTQAPKGSQPTDFTNAPKPRAASP